MVTRWSSCRSYATSAPKGTCGRTSSRRLTCGSLRSRRTCAAAAALLATDESTALAAGAGADSGSDGPSTVTRSATHTSRATDNTRASRSVATDSFKEDLTRHHSMGRDRSILVTQKVTADLRTADKRDAFDPAEMIEPFVEAYRRGDSTGSSDGDESSDFGGDADHMEALAVEGGADRGEPGWASAPRGGFRANYQDLVSGVNKIGHGAYGSVAHQAVVSAHDAAAVSAHSAGSLATMAVREGALRGSVHFASDAAGPSAAGASAAAVAPPETTRRLRPPPKRSLRDGCIVGSLDSLYNLRASGRTAAEALATAAAAARDAAARLTKSGERDADDGDEGEEGAAVEAPAAAAPEAAAPEAAAPAATAVTAVGGGGEATEGRRLCQLCFSHWEGEEGCRFGRDAHSLFGGGVGTLPARMLPHFGGARDACASNMLGESARLVLDSTRRAAWDAGPGRAAPPLAGDGDVVGGADATLGYAAARLAGGGGGAPAAAPAAAERGPPPGGGGEAAAAAAAAAAARAEERDSEYETRLARHWLSTHFDWTLGGGVPLEGDAGVAFDAADMLARGFVERDAAANRHLDPLLGVAEKPPSRAVLDDETLRGQQRKDPRYMQLDAELFALRWAERGVSRGAAAHLARLEREGRASNDVVARRARS